MECGKLDSHMEETLASRRRGRGKEVVTKGHAKEGGLGGTKSYPQTQRRRK